MKVITTQEAARLIQASTAAFGVRFIKRHPKQGEKAIRSGQFAYGPRIKKGLAGGQCPYSFSEKGLLPVYRVMNDRSNSKGMRRSIPIEGITYLAINGEKYTVVPA